MTPCPVLEIKNRDKEVYRGCTEEMTSKDKEMTIVEGHQKPAAPLAFTRYTRRDGGLLFKGKATEQVTLDGIRTELLKVKGGDQQFITNHRRELGSKCRAAWPKESFMPGYLWNKGESKMRYKSGLHLS